jgi:hypothetical protein
MMSLSRNLKRIPIIWKRRRLGEAKRAHQTPLLGGRRAPKPGMPGAQNEAKSATADFDERAIAHPISDSAHSKPASKRMVEVRVLHKDARCLPRPSLPRLQGKAGWAGAGAAALAVMLSACSSLGGLSGSSAPPAPASAATPAPAPASSNASFASRVKTLFAGGDSGNSSSPAPQPAGGSAAADIDCPSVEYRQGAAAYAVNTPGAENSALSLQYQASFTQTARECVLHGNDLTIKVGVQGRVVVGPAGAPSSVTIPLRYALVREGMEPKTLWTKLFTVPVTIPQNQLNLPWLHIEEEMTVPRPSADELEAYVIYVGFDPEGAAAPKPRPAAKPKGRASAMTQ